MSEGGKENRSGCAIAVTIGFVLLPVLYLLSIGPAVWLVEHKRMPEPLAEVIYAPVLILADWAPAFRNLLEWYIQFWD